MGSLSSSSDRDPASNGDRWAVNPRANHYNDCIGGRANPCYKKFLVILTLTSFCARQSRREWDHPLRQAVRGTHGAVAAGSEYATEAGMRIYYHGGNAVDAGVAAMFAASVTELSHFGMGGEAPILIRTKTGKVYSIAGVGTMPKLATARDVSQSSAYRSARFWKRIPAD